MVDKFSLASVAVAALSASSCVKSAKHDRQAGRAAAEFVCKMWCNLGWKAHCICACKDFAHPGGDAAHGGNLPAAPFHHRRRDCLQRSRKMNAHLQIDTGRENLAGGQVEYAPVLL